MTRVMMAKVRMMVVIRAEEEKTVIVAKPNPDGSVKSSILCYIHTALNLSNQLMIILTPVCHEGRSKTGPLCQRFVLLLAYRSGNLA
jgi:hypothetical protein